jgi:hypothetical protein
VPRNRGKHTTLVAALTPDGLRVPWMFEGAMDATTFAWYITEELAPTLRPGQVVVLDNLSVHKAARIRQALAARQCEVLFLPALYTKVELHLSGIVFRGGAENTRGGAEERLCRPCGATASSR